jgi:REP element-mobilizing transposase RayT
MEPLYTAASVKAAYQLRWSLAVFARSPLPPAEKWLSALKQVTEQDGVRILEVCARSENVWHFFLTTRPDVAPPAIVKSVKGRLQHRLRPTNSIGSLECRCWPTICTWWPGFRSHNLRKTSH